MRTTALTGLAALALGLAACASHGPPGSLPGGRSATFDVRHEVTVEVPEGARDVQVWMALPRGNDPAQTIHGLDVEAPFDHQVTTDSEGNEYLYLHATDPEPGTHSVLTEFQVTRREVRFDTSSEGVRPLDEDETSSMHAYLEPDEHVVIDDGIRALAAEIVGDETDPMRKARLIYDWELDHVDYWVKYPDRLRSSGVGSSEYCLTEGTGNCTDFHSLYAALSRAAGIPTRIVYGSFFKQPLDGVDRDQSYHCWIEFYCPGRGWVPLDVAVADVFVGDFPDTPENTEKVDLTVAAGYDGADPALVDYYFGNLEERRVSWCVGRDVLLSPAPAAGRLNAVPKAHVEIDGAAVGEKQGWTRKLTFRER